MFSDSSNRGMSKPYPLTVFLESLNIQELAVPSLSTGGTTVTTITTTIIIITADITICTIHATIQYK